MDEAGLNLGMTRRFARSIAGERAIGSVPRNKGANVTLLGVLSLDGLIAVMTIPGGMSTEVFLTYVTQVERASIMARGSSRYGQSPRSSRALLCELRLSLSAQN